MRAGSCVNVCVCVCWCVCVFVCFCVCVFACTQTVRSKRRTAGGGGEKEGAYSSDRYTQRCVYTYTLNPVCVCTLTSTHARTHSNTQTHAHTTASPPTNLCVKAAPGGIPEKAVTEKAVLDPKMAAAKFKELGNLKYKEGKQTPI